MYKRGDCKMKYTAEAEQARFPEYIEWQVVQMDIEGASMSGGACSGRKRYAVSRWLGEMDGCAQ